MKMKTLLTTFFLLLSAVSIAQVTFEAKVSKKSLGVNERLRVDFEMNQDGDNFQPPKFDGFRVIAGPNQSISNSWVNGKRSFSKTYSYFLTPTSRGTFTIGQATIEIDGKTYKTVPVDVEVTKAVDKPKDGDDNEMDLKDNIHLVAEISNSNPYLNEGIHVVYKLYVSHDTSVSNWNEIDSPDFADFWSQNTDNKEFRVREGTYRGKPYRYVVLRNTVLYPQKTGKLEINPLALDVQVDVPTNRRDIFGRPFMKRVNQTVAADKRIIDVKKLPVEGRPADFSGAVGSFDFNVSSNKTKLDASESLELEVKVSGNGNLKLFNLPEPSFASALEVYDPEFADRVSTSESGMRGSISNTYTVIPQRKGKYPIKPIVFSYFDPKTESYKSITSKELWIEVSGGPETGSSVADSDTATRKKQPVLLAEEQFKYIKLRAKLKPKEEKPFFQSTLFWSLVISPLLLLPVLMFVGKKRYDLQQDVEGKRLRRANKLAKKYLSHAKKNNGNAADFYESLERALHNYLKAKLSIETSDFSKERIDTLLQEKNVSPDTSSSFINLLKNCEFARYAPTKQGVIEEDYKKAVEVIATIDKQISS